MGRPDPSYSKAMDRPTSAASGADSASAPASDIPWVPTTAITSPDNYGGLNPENEASLDYIDGVTSKNYRQIPRHLNRSTSSPDTSQRDEMKAKASTNEGLESDTKSSRFAALPAEIIDAVLSHLSPIDLIVTSATCRDLRRHALSDPIWRPIVQDNVPCTKVNSPTPFLSFAELYKEYDRFWFLPKYKLWFSDRHLTGKLILARYDDRRGCIEGFELLAVSSSTSYEEWPANPPVVIHRFKPKVRLHLDKPVFSFRAGDKDLPDGGFSQRPGANRYGDDIPMVLDDRLQNMYSNFQLTKAMDEDEANDHLESEYPYDNVWPPPAVPARHHVHGAHNTYHPRGTRLESGESSSDTGRPQIRSEVSDQTFRIRRWIQMAGSAPHPAVHGNGTDQMGGYVGSAPFHATAGTIPTPAENSSTGAVGLRLGETLMTYSTLDPETYTPTPTKPWRGIWVGDYSGHGCELLLINQPDDPPATDEELGLIRGDIESDEMWEKRRLNARIYRGRLEAIKLTGDPNVPRGEYTFVADDLGEDGLVGLATEEPFTGARVVRSKGHVAGTGFVQDKFIESQLLMLSPDRLAQYWVGFGHISFFERVNIDEHLDP